MRLAIGATHRGNKTRDTPDFCILVSQTEDAHDTFVAQNVPAADHQSPVGDGSSEYLADERETAGQEDRNRAAPMSLAVRSICSCWPFGVVT